jgi:hypothetical protein
MADFHEFPGVFSWRRPALRLPLWQISVISTAPQTRTVISMGMKYTKPRAGMPAQFLTYA